MFEGCEWIKEWDLNPHPHVCILDSVHVHVLTPNFKTCGHKQLVGTRDGYMYVACVLNVHVYILVTYTIGLVLIASI